MEDFGIDRAALLSAFDAEARELLDEMERRLLFLETAPDDQETLHALFRAAHTLKGGALLNDLGAIQSLTHATENLLERWRDGTVATSSGLVTLLLRVVDALRAGVAAGVQGRPADDTLLQRLTEALAAAAAAAPPAPADSSGPAVLGSPAAAGKRTLRVDVAKLDRMLDLTGELAIARGRVADLLERPAAVSREELLEANRQTDRLFLELQELVVSARMVAIGPMLESHRRTVRDVAAAVGKRARLVVLGGDVEVDTAIIEGVKDPIGHMIRNAVDHGLESPADRERAGKDPVGTVTLRAFPDGGGIVVQVADDGRGIDRAAVAERAARLGLVTDPARVSHADAARLILEPGLSTTDEVSAFSGRGVGMDVVRRNVEALRGTIDVESVPGRGTSVTLRLPLTLAIIQGFRLNVAGDVYVVPLDAVLECLDLPEAEDRTFSEGVMELRGQPLPFLRLRRLLGLGGAPTGRECVAVIGHGAQRVGLAVDGLLGESQVVVKPLPRALRGLPGLSGSAILGDGRVALVLDVPGLLRLAQRSSASPIVSSPSPLEAHPSVSEEP